MIDAVKSYLLSLQDRICSTLEVEDGTASFHEDLWSYPSGGGGRTRVVNNGAIFEKGGVNFSHVFAASLPPSATARHPELAGRPFQAMGLSLVLHPLNPYVPTVHLNLRFFMAEKQNETAIWWFGGGFDLTPYYGFEEDCRHWHRTAQRACDPFGKDLYPQFKKACDDYFYLPHRCEARGIGGIFFDDFKRDDFETSFSFVKSVGDHFLPAYQPIMQRRKITDYTQKERDFQNYRRGRYVEFNLLYDRGTLFGIQSGGRTESILISLPPQVHWHYQWQPEPNSVESRFMQEFLIARDWA